MTIRDYIGQKFSAYGDLSEADMLDFSIKSGYPRTMRCLVNP